MNKRKNNIITMSILMNLVISGIFVGLNIWALKMGFEETFVFLAIAFGFVVIVGNVILVSWWKK